MNQFDPFGLLHEQRRREAVRRELAYAGWCAFAMMVVLGMLVWGCA